MKLTITMHRDARQPLDARVQLVAVADLTGTAPALERGVHVLLRYLEVGIDVEALLDEASDVVLRRRVLLPEARRRGRRDSGFVVVVKLIWPAPD